MIEVKLRNNLILLLDDQDAWVVENYSLVADRRGGTWYVRAQEKGPGAARKPKHYLHRMLMGFPVGMDIDHKDGNGLNNQRNNLRVANRTQNNLNRQLSSTNRSGYKGVFWNAQRGRWYAKLTVDGVTRKKGYFITAEEGAIAYSQLVITHACEFGRLSEPGSETH